MKESMCRVPRNLKKRHAQVTGNGKASNCVLAGQQLLIMRRGFQTDVWLQQARGGLWSDVCADCSLV
mgnify:CR=1 FL=1